MSETATTAAFNDLLEAYALAESPEERESAKERIWATWGQERVVFVLDMSGFSRITQRFGAVHYLSMVRRMQLAMTKLVARYEGQLVKFEADNCFATFPDAAGAIKTGIGANNAFDGMNVMTPDDLDIHIACGIDHGQVLCLGTSEIYGEPVNLASKLGEDIGEPGDILVTKAAFATLENPELFEADETSYSISGIKLDVHRVQV